MSLTAVYCHCKHLALFLQLRKAWPLYHLTLQLVNSSIVEMLKCANSGARVQKAEENVRNIELLKIQAMFILLEIFVLKIHIVRGCCIVFSVGRDKAAIETY